MLIYKEKKANKSHSEDQLILATRPGQTFGAAPGLGCTGQMPQACRIPLNVAFLKCRTSGTSRATPSPQLCHRHRHSLCCKMMATLLSVFGLFKKNKILCFCGLRLCVQSRRGFYFLLPEGQTGGFVTFADNWRTVSS